MEFEWFIVWEGKQQGPYTFRELQRMEGLTPETLAWREGMSEWLPIREIPELKDLFKEEAVEGFGEDLAVNFPQADPSLFFWLVFLIILVAYALLQIFS